MKSIGDFWTYILVIGTSLILHVASVPIVTTKYGKIVGTQNGSSLMFVGIPYAQPPTGDLRWKPPVDAKPWSPSILNATDIKPACPQYLCPLQNPGIVCPPTTSEDCLYLNIWTPLSATPTSGLAVMLYLHGGEFTYMSSGSILYNGERIASKGNVVYIGVDYRMGALGFFVTGLTETDARGNYGLQDQKLAFKWVYENIKNFGGDPTKITWFGQSAGSQSIATHLMNPNLNNYYRGVLLESSPFTLPYKTYTEALTLASRLSENLQCKPFDMTCLRNKSAEDIAIAQLNVSAQVSSLKLLELFEPWGPYIDGNEVTMLPIDGVKKGLFQKKPMVIGTNSEEAYLFIYLAWSTPVRLPEAALIVEAVEPGHLLDIIKQYPPRNPLDERDQLSVASTDLIFACSTRFAIRQMIDYGNSDIYLYMYDHATSFDQWGTQLSFCNGHVCHGAEIVMVFQTASLGGLNYTQEELVLSDSLIQYWTNFAKTLDPNQGSGSVPLKWPKYSNDTGYTSIWLKTPALGNITEYDKSNCDFWDTIGYDEK